MKKIVISGSSKLQDKVNYWLEHFKNKDYKNNKLNRLELWNQFY